MNGGRKGSPKPPSQASALTVPWNPSGTWEGWVLSQCPVCLWQLLIMCDCWDLHEESHFSFLSSSSRSSSLMPSARRLNTDFSDGQQGADRRRASTVTVEGYITMLWPPGINRLVSPVLGVQVKPRSGMAGNEGSFRSVSLVLPVIWSVLSSQLSNVGRAWFTEILKVVPNRGWPGLSSPFLPQKQGPPLPWPGLIPSGPPVPLGSSRSSGLY